MSTKKKKQGVGHSGWPFAVIGRQSTDVGRDAANDQIRLLHQAWTRAVTEVDRLLSLHDRKMATAGDVARARQTAEEAWQPYKGARAKALPPPRAPVATNRVP